MRLRLPLVIACIACLTATAPARAGESSALPDAPADFCVTVREVSASVPRGHYQFRLRVCAASGAELVRVDDYPEIYDDIHRRVTTAPVAPEALRALYARIESLPPGDWARHEVVDGHELAQPVWSGGPWCGLAIEANDHGRSFDCTRGIVAPSSQADRDATLAAIFALIPAAGWRALDLSSTPI